MRQATKQKRKHIKASRYHPKAMEYLMQQAYAEDHRREQMAELDRLALQHLSDSWEAERG